MSFKIFSRIKEPKIYFWFIALGILIFALPFSLLLYPKKESLPLSYYLPEDVSFYLEIDRDFWLKERQGIYNWLDFAYLDEFYSGQTDYWGPYFPQLEKMIVFKRSTDLATDNFLLYFSRLPDKSYLKKWQEEHKELKLEIIGSRIIFIGQAGSAELNFGKRYFYPSDFYNQAELSFYGSVVTWPEFLTELIDFLPDLDNAGEVLLTISASGRQVDIVQSARERPKGDFSSLLTVEDMDFGLGSLTLTSQEESRAVSQVLFGQLFPFLPYQYLPDRSLTDILSSSVAVFSQEQNWLLTSLPNSALDIWRFLNELPVKEVSKKLPDGTSYYELTADLEYSFLEQEYSDQKYWQMANLYGFNQENQQYLTNSQEIIYKLINRPVSIGELLSCGKTKHLLINDFLWLKTPKLEENNALKDLLQEYKIDYFRAFSYNFAGFSGIRACF